MEKYKTCNGCKQNLPYSSFSKKTGPKAAKSGLRSRCKSCEIAAYKDYRKRNPEKVRETKRNWVKKNPDKKAEMDKKHAEKNKEKISAYQKEYREKNADAIKAQQKIWRAENKEAKAKSDREWALRNPDAVAAASKRYRERHPEKAKDNTKRYAAKNPEVRRQSIQRRRARLAQAEIKDIKLRDLKRILSRPCAYCGALSQHIDHVIPIARGGGHKIGNLIGSCQRCNQSKGAQLVSEWKLRRKKLGY